MAIYVDDSTLVQQYMNGDEKAFENLIIRHKNKLFKYIYLKVKDQVLAEDIFQETFIKVIHTIKLGSYNEDGKFLSWVMRIAHNLIIDHFRRNNKIRHISDSSSYYEHSSIFDFLSVDELNIQEQTTLEELKTQMVDLIDYLPEPQQTVLRQRIFQDLSFKEIADIENISISTALGRMRYALINIRKMIKKHQLVTEI